MSETQSTSQALTPSQSGSLTASPTRTPSLTATGTKTASQTESLSPSPSQTLSASPSQSQSVSQAATPSNTGTQTPSQFASGSLSQSPTGAASPTQSPSRTSSATPSQSVTGSWSPSVSSTATATTSMPGSPTATPNALLCRNGVLDPGESDVDCGPPASGCPLCVPGRACLPALGGADCDASLGNASGTALPPGTPGVACNAASALCEDVRASQDAWVGLVAPEFLALDLQINGLRASAFSAVVFRAVQASVAASLALGSPPLLLAPSEVLVVEIVTAVGVGGSRSSRLRLLRQQQESSSGNASNLTLWLLLPRSGPPGNASVLLLQGWGPSLVSAAAAAASAAALPSGAPAGNGTFLSASLVTTFPPFPLAAQRGGAPSPSAGPSQLAPGVIAAIVIFVLLAVACCVGIGLWLFLRAARQRKEDKQGASVVGRSGREGVQLDPQFFYRSPMQTSGAGPRVAGSKSPRPPPVPRRSLAEPTSHEGPDSNGFYSNPLSPSRNGKGNHPAVVRKAGGGGGSSSSQVPDADGMFGNPMRPAALATHHGPGVKPAAAAQQPYQSLAGYRGPQAPRGPSPRSPHVSTSAAALAATSPRPDAEGMFSNPISRTRGGPPHDGPRQGVPVKVSSAAAAAVPPSGGSAATLGPDGMHANPIHRRQDHPPAPITAVVRPSVPSGGGSTTVADASAAGGVEGRLPTYTNPIRTDTEGSATRQGALQRKPSNRQGIILSPAPVLTPPVVVLGLDPASSRAGDPSAGGGGGGGAASVTAGGPEGAQSSFSNPIGTSSRRGGLQRRPSSRRAIALAGGAGGVVPTPVPPSPPQAPELVPRTAAAQLSREQSGLDSVSALGPAGTRKDVLEVTESASSSDAPSGSTDAAIGAGVSGRSRPAGLTRLKSSRMRDVAVTSPMPTAEPPKVSSDAGAASPPEVGATGNSPPISGSTASPPASDASSPVMAVSGRSRPAGLTRLNSSRLRDPSSGASPASPRSPQASGAHRSKAFFNNSHMAKRMQVQASFRATAFDAQLGGALAQRSKLASAASPADTVDAAAAAASISHEVTPRAP
jgi:hypothetical protein